MKNTYAQTSVRCIVFHEKGMWYGVALEFNVVVDGDSPAVAMDLLNQAVGDYYAVAKKKKLDVRVLNQTADPEYAAMWSLVESSTHAKKTTRRIPSNVYGSMVLRPAFA